MLIFHLLMNNLRILLSERKTLMVIVLMPIILTTILSFALEGVFGDSPQVPQFKVAVVKAYADEAPEEILDAVYESAFVQDRLPEDVMDKIYETAHATDIEKIFFEDFLGNAKVLEIMQFDVMNDQEAMAALNADAISAIVRLPEDFLRASYTNLFTPMEKRLEVEVVRNPNKRVTADIAVSLIRGFLNQIESAEVRKNVAVAYVFESGLMADYEETFEGVAQSGGNDTLMKTVFNDETGRGKPAIDSRSYYSVGMLTLFVLFSAGRGSYLLLREKRDFTYQRMRISGLSLGAILAGKFLTLFFLVVLQLVLLILYSTLILGVQWGSFMSTFILSGFTAFAVAGLGSLLAAVTFAMEKTRVASLFESIVFQVMGLLGGSYIPLEVLPKKIQVLGKVPLNGVALDAYLKVMSGEPIRNLSGSLVILAINGLVLSAMSLVIIWKKERCQNDSNYKTQTAGA